MNATYFFFNTLPMPLPTAHPHGSTAALPSPVLPRPTVWRPTAKAPAKAKAKAPAPAPSPAGQLVSTICPHNPKRVSCFELMCFRKICLSKCANLLPVGLAVGSSRFRQVRLAQSPYQSIP